MSVRMSESVRKSEFRTGDRPSEMSGGSLDPGHRTDTRTIPNPESPMTRPTIGSVLDYRLLAQQRRPTDRAALAADLWARPRTGASLGH